MEEYGRYLVWVGLTHLFPIHHNNNTTTTPVFLLPASSSTTTMPYVRCVYSGAPEKQEELSRSLSAAVASGLGKPEMYVCVEVIHSSNLFFGGSKDPAAMVEVSSVGGSCSAVIGPITEAVSKVNVSPQRIFVNFQVYTGANWGMNGSTFG